MKYPQLFISWFDDERGRTSYYLDRMESLSVPKPKEILVPLESSISFEKEAAEIKSIMDEEGWNRAFLKTECKAAVNNLKDGSFILEKSNSHIEATIESLLTQNNAQDWPHGNYLVVREWMNLNFCLELAHSCHPEVRYFIDDGEVIGKSPHNYSGEKFVCRKQYPHLEDCLSNSSPPDELAKQVANEFDEASWGVDFALDTNGNWWFVEMNFNCVYWHSEYEEWWNMCGQGDNELFSPLWIHSAALPDMNEF